MAIYPKCGVNLAGDCDDELMRPGGILLSPPDDNDLVQKLHVCIPCWSLLQAKKASRELFPSERVELVARLLWEQVVAQEDGDFVPAPDDWQELNIESERDEYRELAKRFILAVQ